MSWLDESMISFIVYHDATNLAGLGESAQTQYGNYSKKDKSFHNVDY